MALYRCYFFDCEAHILAVEVLDCEADEVARRLARSLALSRSYKRAEVWDGSRLVERIEPVASAWGEGPALGIADAGARARRD